MPVGKTVRDIELGTCPKCTAPLVLDEEIDIIDELAKLADNSSAKVELISDDFEEGLSFSQHSGGLPPFSGTGRDIDGF